MLKTIKNIDNNPPNVVILTMKLQSILLRLFITPDIFMFPLFKELKKLTYKYNRRMLDFSAQLLEITASFTFLDNIDFLKKKHNFLFKKATKC